MKNKEKFVYQFKITLRDVNPPIWRQFQVESDMTLRKLAASILTLMGWSGGHLHQFYMGGKYYGIPDDEFESGRDTIDEKTVKLIDLTDQEMKRFDFEYDFGDGWEHAIECEKIFMSEGKIRYPICIDGARNCPPEDCGGSGGYEDFLNAIKNPKHPEHKSLLTWIGGKFGPEEFDLKDINDSLKDTKLMESFFDEL
ncbi:MAG: plasmid pRiA4b ORF-3 family protein [Candidatus Omnitrophica bacterium]|nr:plasmid pRiA4b ORF-3 family protein [Candidatus Omnitrophota bacterium]